RCSHLQYWHQGAQACVPCETGYPHHVPLRGREFTVNCGVRDTGGRFAAPSQECPPGSFNDGRFLLCEPCSPCPSGAQLAPCTRLRDTQCCPPGSGGRMGGASPGAASLPSSVTPWSGPTSTAAAQRRPLVPSLPLPSPRAGLGPPLGPPLGFLLQRHQGALAPPQALLRPPPLDPRSAPEGTNPGVTRQALSLS
ncbi:hypothetical protein G0U57_018020, partial [Chelydra serpentina]